MSYFAGEKGTELEPAMAAEVADLIIGEVESAHSSARFICNVIARKKREETGTPR